MSPPLGDDTPPPPGPTVVTDARLAAKRAAAAAAAAAKKTNGAAEPQPPPPIAEPDPPASPAAPIMGPLAELRIRVRDAGFSPIPVTGKKCLVEGWPALRNVPDADIVAWTQAHPLAPSTGS